MHLYNRRILIFGTFAKKIYQNIGNMIKSDIDPQNRDVMTMPMEPGFSVYNIADFTVPVLVSVPHAGRDYPIEIQNNLRLSSESLLRLEDRYADLLARQGRDGGIPTIIAHRARTWIDLNRAENDIDVDMITDLSRQNMPAPGMKQRGGLGLIPRRLSGVGDIWRGPIAVADLQNRIVSYHRTYHAAIAAILSQMRDQFGVAILLDLHSMPPIPPSATTKSPHFVIGDRFGSSASSRVSEMLLSRLRQLGHMAALNAPYSGDHILRQHGAPHNNIHAVQLEVDRSLYLDSNMREPTANVGLISNIINDLIEVLIGFASNDPVMQAAE